ncbi:MAG: chorismate mutase [Simkaniaceae bacterium]|nr:chorismate mutase [Simkaniaceae bacterium]
MDINSLRKEIDAINEEIIRLFSQRLKLSLKIAHVKKHSNLAVFDEARENALHDEIERLSKLYGLGPQVMQNVFTAFVNYSREVMQKEIE